MQPVLHCNSPTIGYYALCFTIVLQYEPRINSRRPYRLHPARRGRHRPLCTLHGCPRALWAALVGCGSRLWATGLT